jgi:tRNA(Arg) A34 adenosine deaminase TadA
MHAEVDALQAAQRKLTRAQLAKATLYVARAKRASDGSGVWQRGLAKPCDACMRAAGAVGISQVFYTTDGDGDGGGGGGGGGGSNDAKATFARADVQTAKPRTGAFKHREYFM